MSTDTSTPTKQTASSKVSPAQKKKSTSLPAETVDYLKAWMMSPEHIAHPYPTEQEKSQIMADTGIELKQLTNWFVNNRKRFWKPRVEARIQQETGSPVVPAAPSVPTTAEVNVPPSLKRKSSSPSLIVGAPAPLAPQEVTQEQLMTNLAASTTSLIRRVSAASLHAMVSDIDTSSSGSSSGSSSASSSQYSSDAELGSVCEEDNDSDAASRSHSSSNDEVSQEGLVARTESVGVHILRPLSNGAQPAIADVSILTTVPAERIMCTYENCPLKYSFPLNSIEDRKKVQNRRDAEIVRLKQKFLKLYLEECGLVTNTPPKRSFEAPQAENTPRKKFCLESPSLWKKACQTAVGVDDIDLPTLEEATLLFGFSHGLSA